MRALIFDLDGTLVDSVYGHVLAFQIAFAEARLPVEARRIHRHVGMSGDLLTQAMARDSGYKASRQKLKSREERHSHLLRKLLPKPESLDAVGDLLAARRAGMLPIGMLTGGYDENELIEAGSIAFSRIRRICMSI